jgi:hypothetical protein
VIRSSTGKVGFYPTRELAVRAAKDVAAGGVPAAVVPCTWFVSATAEAGKKNTGIYDIPAPLGAGLRSG